MYRYLQASVLLVGTLLTSQVSRSQPTFVNWETAPVRPLALSPNKTTLALANLPAARLEVYDLTPPEPRLATSIPVGLDPVTVKYRSNEEVWVVCHISDTINVVDLTRNQIRQIIPTRDAPADVVFAGNPQRAYVSSMGENVIQVFHPETFVIEDTITIKGQRPRSLAVSSDRQTVYAAIFESGNATTILSSRFSQDFVPGSVVDWHEGPYLGVNPPPNHGDAFEPPITETLATPPPRVGLIVRKNDVGHWMDDNGGDWTAYVSGPKASLTGRPVGWDMPDRDLALIDTQTHSVDYATRLMNICMDIAVHPTTGDVIVIGTDARNEVRFEPQLNGQFLDVLAAIVPTAKTAPRLINLNPHLTDQESPFPRSIREQSLGDPRQIVWSDNGETAYVAGMGSNNLVILNQDGNRQSDRIIPLDAGPAGLALHSERNRLYIYHRFAAALTVWDTERLTQQTKISLFDPTPDPIRRGRPHFYDTHKTSGPGHLSCASCHVDGRLDRLAWDLGSPEAPMIEIDPNQSFESELRPAAPIPFHPMKGPMVTMTLQDIIGHEPFHWRGDRASIEAFNPTFSDLQDAESLLKPTEMSEFKDLLKSIHFPPNRYRTFRNELSPQVPLDDHFTLGRDGNGQDAGERFARTGDALAGRSLFLQQAECTECHTGSTGLGAHQRFERRRWNPIPDGPHGERFVSLVQQERNNELPFKIASLRGLSDKVGADFFHLESPVGFGFSHNGGVDTLTRFVQDGFDFVEDESTANLIAFLLSFTGSEISNGDPKRHADPPGLPSLDTHAAVGTQILVNAHEAPPQRLRNGLALTRIKDDPVDVVAWELGPERLVSYFYSAADDVFLSDSLEPPRTLQELIDSISSESHLLFMIVPPNTGRRIAIDWDSDEILNGTELTAGFDPYNPRSTPENLPPVMTPVPPIALTPGESLELQLSIADGNDPPDPYSVTLVAPSPTGAKLTDSAVLTWTPPSEPNDQPWIFAIEAFDPRDPKIRTRMEFPIFVIAETHEVGAKSFQLDTERVTLRWNVIPGQTYQVSYADDLIHPHWIPLNAPWLADATDWEVHDEGPIQLSRYYRIVALTD